ncbi:lysylphosphatidylglycerol synthase transmembrane domain-containing protein [Patulibacter minatonensis]|uniref:lysylphosphatidylglycerol synthase transmembrane domain-containing protein n=1 Tax=Patulibacter minatonensis TaxID=298163 RepID=UPI00146FA967|nr:lysylphosphatidylglycerol synthase transmembrane domain-containing protein [Patulibacter minatonensis]
MVDSEPNQEPAGTGHPFPRDPDAPSAPEVPSGPPEDHEAPTTSGLFKRVLIGIGAILVMIIVVRLLAPHVGFLNDTWQKVRTGDPVWLIVAVVLEGFSFAGYVYVFNATARRAGLMLPRFTSWRIVLAGVAATRLLATAGAGGIASTTFALRRHGLDARHAAATVAAQIAIIYVWFVLLIAVCGFALFVFGHGHNAITIVPAGIAVLLLVVAVLGRSALRRLAGSTSEREGKIARALASIPGTLDDGVHTVSTLVRERDPAIFGGALWWLADAAVLWAACHAFGASPNVLDICMAYLIGQVANLLPIPGGLGVEAGLLGMLIAFGVPGGVAVLASLTQRLVSTWLPALPGAIALAAIGRPSPDAEVVPVDEDDHRPHGPSPAAA